MGTAEYLKGPGRYCKWTVKWLEVQVKPSASPEQESTAAAGHAVSSWDFSLARSTCFVPGVKAVASTVCSQLSACGFSEVG